MELVTIEVRLPKEVYDSASELLAKQGYYYELYTGKKEIQ